MLTVFCNGGQGHVCVKVVYLSTWLCIDFVYTIFDTESCPCATKGTRLNINYMEQSS